ncbi:hypothetical protein FD754_023997, partial [Muntiacus muntjak]
TRAVGASGDPGWGRVRWGRVRGRGLGAVRGPGLGEGQGSAKGGRVAVGPHPMPQVCSRAPAQQQYSSQNLTEIVHCFIALARSYPKELMKFFLSQMEMSKEAVRVGTLALIRAVVSADEPRMSLRTIYLAIRVVKNTLSDTRSKVRMAILRIIGQLALSGFQDRIKGWGLKYVSVQLTLSTYKLTNRRDNFYQRDLEEKMVHKVTMDTVRIITSSVSGMTNVSWPTGLAYWG